MKRTKELSVNTWKMLRALVREERLTGKQLRQYNYGRRSKDGTFLDALVEDGLLTVKSLQPAPPGRSIPQQFRTVYELTELGRTAAEFGEYEYEWTPPAKAEKGKSK